ncbi:flippase [Ferrovum sp.]|uniref:flippase n=1 Tax=Ferrovum sp. TaxID=2609467 RepID=UPI00261CEE3E|nr:flippase [Ferrovum sp.]
MSSPSFRPLRIGHATLVNALGTVIPGLVMVATVPLYIRSIGEARYGVLALLWLLLGYFGVFDLGFGRALTNRFAALPPDAHLLRQRAFWTGLGLSLGAGCLGGGILYALGTHFLDTFSLTGPLRQECQATLPWVLFALPLATVLSILSGALMGQQAFVALNGGQALGNLLFQLCPLILAVNHHPTLPALVPAALLGRSVSVIALGLACRCRIPITGPPRFSAAEIRPLLHFGGWVTVTALAGPLLTVFDRFVIGALSGVTAVTAYTVPFNLVNYLMIFPASLQKALTPTLTAASEPDARQHVLHYTRLLTTLMTVSVLLALLGLKTFLDLWLGPRLALTTEPIGTVLLLGIWINALAFIPFTHLQCRNRPDLPARFHLLELLPYGLVLWGLISTFGAVGAAWAWDLRVAVDALLLFWAAGNLQALRHSLGEGLLLALAFALTQLLPSPSLLYLALACPLILLTLWRAWTRFPRRYPL